VRLAVVPRRASGISFEQKMAALDKAGPVFSSRAGGRLSHGADPAPEQTPRKESESGSASKPVEYVSPLRLYRAPIKQPVLAGLLW